MDVPEAHSSFKRYKDLLEDKASSDVILSLTDSQGTTKDLYGHQVILSVSSPVLQDRLKNMKVNKKTKKRIRIRDTDYDTFKVLLVYIYCDRLEVDVSQVRSVLDAALKFKMNGMMEALKDACLLRFQANCLNQMIEFSVANHDHDLMVWCMKALDMKGSLYLKQQGIKDLSSFSVKGIISRDTLAANEVDVFEACYVWAGHELERKEWKDNPGNRRRVMEPFINDIRFPVMSPQEFDEVVVPKGILSFRECYLVMRAMVSRGQVMTDCMFNPKPRGSFNYNTNYSYQGSTTGSPDTGLTMDMN
jgi:hypothetical protein